MISERLSYVRAWIASLMELRKVPLILSQLVESLVVRCAAGAYYSLGFKLAF